MSNFRKLSGIVCLEDGVSMPEAHQPAFRGQFRKSSAFLMSETSVLRQLSSDLQDSFEQICRDFSAEDISVLMPTYMPQQGRLLSEFARAGGKSCISGGKNGRPAFENVPQYGLDFDTSAHLNMFPEGMSEAIVGAIPDEALKDKKIALFTFIPSPKPWSEYIHERDLNAKIVATNEQNTRLFFEKKGNLMHILEEAGLGAYVIPTAVVDASASEQELRDIYNKFKNENGRVVVQPCFEGYEHTLFIDNEDDFMATLLTSKMPRKITRFIEGSEANLSFFSCNTLASETKYGVIKCNLPEGIDLNDPLSLAAIEAHAAEKGIDASNAFSITGRATLKVVGDILLANEPGDGVGNNIGHIYEDGVSAQIAEIGNKLGKKMALCGKVGHAGADLIVDRHGKVWINEINDRQQGPTDQMSADAENEGLPSLSRLAWFGHYADFSRQENIGLLVALKDRADAIHRQYRKSRASFYIKVYATHGAEFNGEVVARKDLTSGVYVVSKRGNEWVWESGSEDTRARPIDLSSGSITLTIKDGGFKAGDKIDSGAEMFRITGTACGSNSPFILENGISCLSPAWVPIVEQLYKDCFGEDYLKKNPLRKSGAPAIKRKPVVPKVDSNSGVKLRAARRVGAIGA